MSVLTSIAYFLGGYSALTMALYLASAVVPRAAFAARTLATYLSTAVCALLGVIISIALRLAGNPGSAQWATGRCYGFAVALTTGITFEAVDPAGHLGSVRPAVFVGNHQTELDVAMLGCIFPKHCSITAKASLKRMPFLGWFMALSDTIFIDRANSRDSREAMARAAAEIRAKRQSVYVFPEGTRSYSDEPMLLDFKKGAFHLAIQAGVPIVPCVVANYSHVLSMRRWLFRAGRIPVKVLDPIPTTGLTAADVDRLSSETRQLMLDELTKLTAEVRKQPVAVGVKAR